MDYLSVCLLLINKIKSSSVILLLSKKFLLGRRKDNKMENSINDGGMLKVNLTLTSSPSSPRVEICVPKSGISSSKLRDEISNATKIPLSSLKLIFRGRLIANKSDGDVVIEYKLEDG